MLTIITNISAFAQFYYINSYIGTDRKDIKNAVLKIDINSKQIVDSLILGINGQFIEKIPQSFLDFNQNRLMITLLFNGISGKNARGEDPITYYFIIDKQNFSIIRQDSLPGSLVSRVNRVNGDSIYFTILDNQIGWIKASYVLGQRNNRLQLVDRYVFDTAHEVYPVIGGHIAPDGLCKLGSISYYHGIIDDGQVLLFSADSTNNIINQLIIGNRAQEVVVVGCNSSDSIIYSILLRFTYSTFSPPDTSEPAIQNEIIRINATNFTIIDTTLVDPGEAYFAKEYGTANIIDNYLLYYFSLGECGDCFVSAYLLIFDTRTNQATWLRVGWR